MSPKMTFILPVMLVACGPADPVANEGRDTDAATEQVAAPVERPPAASTESPAPTPDRAAPPLTAEGWGPLKIGMTLAQIVAAAGPDSDPDAVGGADPAACDQFRPARAPTGMLVMVEEGRLTRVSLIQGSAVETDRSIGIGDGRDEVVKAYGDAAAASAHEYSDKPAGYLDVWMGAAGRDRAAPDPSARGIRYEIDGENAVSAIHAGGPSILYVEGCS